MPDSVEKNVKNIGLIAGPVAGFITGLLLYANGLGYPAALTAGITVLCACWWVLESIPIPATSLIPLAILPLFGVLDKTQVASAYGSPLVLLLLGGFILSTAMERSGAHRRIALNLVNLFGAHNNGRRAVFGFMFTAALLSMWISNTATTLMLLPVALAVLQSTRDQALSMPLLLGICYAASLGGVGTPIGTPPNLIFMEVYANTTGREVGFLEWMRWGVPAVILFLPVMALWLTRNVSTGHPVHIPPAGKWQSHEIRVLLVFGLTALAWVTRKEPFGGWSGYLNLPAASDAAIALTAAVFMFIVPDGKGGRLLDWETANRIPWGMLLLFGGGIAIANAFQVSGLADFLAAHLSLLAGMPVILMILLICLGVSFLTEITSNTATTSLLMPVLAIVATVANIDPALLMVPAAMSASCAFMLPVATAPNAIIFGSGRVPIRVMVRNGLALNLLGAGVITGVCYFVIA